jgi:N-carbamoylputrescine amidase
VSGAYFASSNRVGQSGLGQEFGGRGFAMSPVGEPIAHTDDATRMQVIEIDLDVAEAQKHVYPCYVLG